MLKMPPYASSQLGTVGQAPAILSPAPPVSPTEPPTNSSAHFSKHSIDDPCLPLNMIQVLSPEASSDWGSPQDWQVLRPPASATTGFDSEERSIMRKGTGDFSRCLDFAKALLNKVGSGQL